MRSWPESHSPSSRAGWGSSCRPRTTRRGPGPQDRWWSTGFTGLGAAALCLVLAAGSAGAPTDPPALPARDRSMWPDSHLATTQVKAAGHPPINGQRRSAQQTARVRPGSGEPMPSAWVGCLTVGSGSHHSQSFQVGAPRRGVGAQGT